MSEVYLFIFFAPCWALVGLRWLGLLENELNWVLGLYNLLGLLELWG